MIDLVIRIAEEDFEIMKHNIAVNNPLCPLTQEEMVTTIANGTPLPKGHGRLIDANNITFSEFFDAGDYAQARRGIYNAPTIIEADKAESEK